MPKHASICFVLGDVLLILETAAAAEVVRWGLLDVLKPA